MSTFDDLDDAAKFQRLRHLAIAGFEMGMNSFAVLISRGLVSPDEFSTLMNPVLDILEDVKSEGDDQFSGVVDQFAKLKSLAAQTWKDA